MSTEMTPKHHELGPEFADTADGNPWKRAFIALLMATTYNPFINSKTLSGYVDFVRKWAGDEPADLMVQYFLKSRSAKMQGWMDNFL